MVSGDNRVTAEAIARQAGLLVPEAASAAPAAPTADVAAALPLPVVLVTLAFGALLVGLLAGSMVGLVRKFIGRFGLPLVILSLAWLSWQFLGKVQAMGWSTIWNRAGDGGMSTLGALDLVIAMPISWLPLVADFSRHGHDGRSALRGT